MATGRYQIQVHGTREPVTGYKTRYDALVAADDTRTRLHADRIGIRVLLFDKREGRELACWHGVPETDCWHGWATRPELAAHGVTPPPVRETGRGIDPGIRERTRETILNDRRPDKIRF